MSKDELEGSKSMQDEENVDQERDIKVSEVIDIFLHRIKDIEECASEYIPDATKKYNEKTKDLNSKMENILDELRLKDNRSDIIISHKEFISTSRTLRRHFVSSPVETLEKSLFVSLFSSFDKFIGDLIGVLFIKQPKLYLNINKEIKVSEVLKYNSIQELQQSFLDKEIETIRRKSYQEQFKALENQFDIKLTRFKQWPSFIERSQRRNLFTHCDGIVSKQYIDVCKEVDFKFDKERIVGEQLDVGTQYLFQSCRIV